MATREVTDERVLRAYRHAANAMLDGREVAKCERFAGDIKTPKGEDMFLAVYVTVYRGSKVLLRDDPSTGGLLALIRPGRKKRAK